MKYGCIYADPAWHYKTRTEAGQTRSASHHYRTLSIDEICALPVAALAARDCHLFMWITGPEMVRGTHVRVMEAWGFKPSAIAFVWIKSKIGTQRQGGFFLSEDVFVKGMGHTTRQNCEYVLLGRKGAPRRHSRSIHQVIVAPRREHSRKPDEAYSRIETYVGNTPKIELFARTRWPGWDQKFGDQADKFEAAL